MSKKRNKKGIQIVMCCIHSSNKENCLHSQFVLWDHQSNLNMHSSWSIARSDWHSALPVLILGHSDEFQNCLWKALSVLIVYVNHQTKFLIQSYSLTSGERLVCCQLPRNFLVGLQGPVGSLDEIANKGINTSLSPGMVAEEHLITCTVCTGKIHTL